jgi:hypothetical protein
MIVNNEVVRREASVCVQSRVDVRTLAELAQYWGSKGDGIRTMSKLVSWSIELLGKILRDNEKMDKERMLIEDAEKLLEDLKLMTRGMKSKKLQMAKGFENLRIEGFSPEEYDRRGVFKSIHNNSRWSQGESEMDESIDYDKVAENTRSKIEEEQELRKRIKEGLEKMKKDRKIVLEESTKRELERVKSMCVRDSEGNLEFKVDELDKTGEASQPHESSQIESKEHESKLQPHELSELSELSELRGEIDGDLERINEQGNRTTDQQIRIRSDEEILVYREKRDREQERLLREM